MYVVMVLSGTVTATSGHTLPVEMTNDDYCDDLLHGSDERNTSACSFVLTSTTESRFHCHKDGQNMMYLPTSRVHDGKSDSNSFSHYYCS